MLIQPPKLCRIYYNTKRLFVDWYSPAADCGLRQVCWRDAFFALPLNIFTQLNNTTHKHTFIKFILCLARKVAYRKWICGVQSMVCHEWLPCDSRLPHENRRPSRTARKFEYMCYYCCWRIRGTRAGYIRLKHNTKQTGCIDHRSIMTIM